MNEMSEAEHLAYYRSVNSCPNIKVNDDDSLEIFGWSIYIYEQGRAAMVKGKITFTPFQFRQLLRQMVEDGIEIKDWSCVNLSGWLEE